MARTSSPDTEATTEPVVREVGRTVIYHAHIGPAVEAVVTAMNEDGTVNIDFPHHANGAVMANAEGVKHGRGVWEYEETDEADVIVPAGTDATAALRAQVETQRNEYAALSAQAAGESARQQERIVELERLAGDLQTENDALKKAKK